MRSNRFLHGQDALVLVVHMNSERVAENLGHLLSVPTSGRWLLLLTQSGALALSQEASSGKKWYNSISLSVLLSINCVILGEPLTSLIAPSFMEFGAMLTLFPQKEAGRRPLTNTHKPAYHILTFSAIIVNYTLNRKGNTTHVANI